MKKNILLLSISFVVFLTFWYLFHTSSYSSTHIPTSPVLKQNLQVDIKTVGELESARSTIIASSVKGDLGKIIDIVADGVYVQPGQMLVKMDPTPFEEKRDKLKSQIKEQEGYISLLQQALEWEMQQAEHEDRSAEYELQSAYLEFDKITHGDGPQELSRLKSALQKAKLKYEELGGYCSDLEEIEAQGFLNPIEIRQAQKKLEEEKEAFEMAQMQYETYSQHVLPMQLKKAETSIKRAQINQEEVAKSGLYKVTKAIAVSEQAQQAQKDLLAQLQEAEKELVQTEILASAQGMVVHREEYRAGQRRKPRVGDILVKNQPLIDLPDLSVMVVKTRVREVDLFKIDIGKKATIEIDAYPSLLFNGTISSIGVLALADMTKVGDEKYFEVRIVLDESDPRLRPGMTTRATIHAQQTIDALTIPLHAIFHNAQRTPYCFVACANGSYEKREIEIGVNNEQRSEVKKGLREGELLYLMNPTY